MAELSGGDVQVGRRELLGVVGAAVLVNLVGALGISFTTPDGAWF